MRQRAAAPSTALCCICSVACGLACTNILNTLPKLAPVVPVSFGRGQHSRGSGPRGRVGMTMVGGGCLRRADNGVALWWRGCKRCPSGRVRSSRLTTICLRSCAVCSASANISFRQPNRTRLSTTRERVQPLFVQRRRPFKVTLAVTARKHQRRFH